MSLRDEFLEDLKKSVEDNRLWCQYCEGCYDSGYACAKVEDAKKVEKLKFNIRCHRPEIKREIIIEEIDEVFGVENNKDGNTKLVLHGALDTIHKMDSKHPFIPSCGKIIKKFEGVTYSWKNVTCEKCLEWKNESRCPTCGEEILIKVEWFGKEKIFQYMDLLQHILTKNTILT